MFKDLKAMSEDMKKMSDEDIEMMRQQQIAHLRSAFTWPTIKETLLALGLGLLMAGIALLALVLIGSAV